jgi:histidyl-tRNA synthetase
MLNLEGKMGKLNAKEALKNLLPLKDQVVDILLMTDLTIQTLNSSLLRTLIKGKGEASALAKGAIRELETFIILCQNLGVTSIPINLCIGMSSDYDCLRPGSVIWQMIVELKPGKFTCLAKGGRYDNALEDYRKTAQQQEIHIANREMYSAGFSLAIDKLVHLVGQQCESSVHRAVVDLVVYVVGARPPLKEITHLLKSLWTNGIQCCFVEVPSMKDDEDFYARDLGANHILELGEDGYSKVKSWHYGTLDDIFVIN